MFWTHQTGSTSGPSRSPAPSQPQHQTNFISHIILTFRLGRNLPCSGPALKFISSNSASTNNLSCGPNHDLSWGSEWGSSGNPPILLYPLIAVRFRRSGWIISYTFLSCLISYIADLTHVQLFYNVRRQAWLEVPLNVSVSCSMLLTLVRGGQLTNDTSGTLVPEIIWRISAARLVTIILPQPGTYCKLNYIH